MVIRKEATENGWIWFLEGRMDTTTAPEFRKEMENCPEGIKKLTVDLKMTEYISSAGLRELLSAHKKIGARGGRMIVRGLSEEVREVFVITGFLEILNVEE